MTQLKRPLTLSFQTRGLGRLDENDVVTALTQRVKSKDIEAVQVTDSACRVTMANVSAKQRLISSTITIKNKKVSLNDVDRSITHVTVKDAPYEINDMVVTSALAAYGEVVQGSIRRGKVKDNEIETGTRYMFLYDAKDIVPSTVTVGDFDLRVFCDNNRTECKHCGLTSHPHDKCPVKSKNERASYRCFSTRHMVQDCTNDIVCRYCSQMDTHRANVKSTKILERTNSNGAISPSAAMLIKVMVKTANCLPPCPVIRCSDRCAVVAWRSHLLILFPISWQGEGE